MEKTVEKTTRRKRGKRRAPQGWYTVEDTLRILGWTPPLLYRLMNDGEAFCGDGECLVFFGLRIFKKEVVDTYVEKHGKRIQP